MTFTRSFRAQTWFVHMPDGTIEMMDGRVVERAFRACMVAGTTPIRAVNAPTWTTLAEAMGLPVAALLAGAPRFDAAEIQPSSWRAGAEVDARRLDGRRGRTAAFAAIGMVAALVLLFGTHLASAFGGPERVRHTATVLPRPTVLETNEALPTHPSRLTLEQRLHLAEREAGRDREWDRELARRSLLARRSPLNAP